MVMVKEILARVLPVKNKIHQGAGKSGGGKLSAAPQALQPRRNAFSAMIYQKMQNNYVGPLLNSLDKCTFFLPSAIEGHDWALVWYFFGAPLVLVGHPSAPRAGSAQNHGECPPTPRTKRQIRKKLVYPRSLGVPSGAEHRELKR